MDDLFIYFKDGLKNLYFPINVIGNANKYTKRGADKLTEATNNNDLFPER